MLAALQHEFDAIAEDESVRVVVLAAEGKAFCAGHDLKEMRAKPSLDYYERLFSQCSQMMLGYPAIARAGDRSCSGHRHCGGLPVGGHVRSRSSGEHRKVRCQRR